MRTTDITLNDALIGADVESIRITKSTTSRGTCEFRVRATKATPVVGDRIGVFDHGLRIWGGTINEIKLSPIVSKPGAEAWYECVCTAWEHLLEKRIITAASFTGYTAGQIVAALLTEWFPWEVITGAIQQGASSDALGTVIFRGVNAWEAISELARRSNYAVYIDPDKVLHFTEREYTTATLEVTEENKNYREPVIEITRADYYNRVSMAISYEAFTASSLTLQGDATWPSFRVYESSDETKTPVAIDVIRKITLNGIDQTFSVKSAGDSTTFYYTPGDSLIEWDATMATPTPEDVITVEWYSIGANVITVSDDIDISARAGIENGTGIYHAYTEDMDCKSVDDATARCEAFLDLHCPRRREQKDAGDMPRSYSWVMYSDELTDGTNRWTQDLFPGRLIRFKPSTPMADDVRLVIQQVDIEDVPGSARRNYSGRADSVGMFRYKITAIDVARLADDMDLYSALAEVGPSLSGVKDFPSEDLDEHRVTIGLSGATTVADDIAPHVEISYDEGYVFRPKAAWITADEVTEDLLVDLQYSDDPYDTDTPARTWHNIFETATGDLVLAAGDTQRPSPLGRFAGFPAPLDIPARAIIRMNIKGGAATDVKVQLVGTKRKAA